jgi:hypothetical protein
MEAHDLMEDSITRSHKIETPVPPPESGLHRIDPLQLKLGWN